jgi:hypothetical protein
MLRELMPFLVDALGSDAGANFTIEVGTSSAPNGKKRSTRD